MQKKLDGFTFNAIEKINNKIDSIKNVDLKKYPFAEDLFSVYKPTTELIIDEIAQLKNGIDSQVNKDLTLSKNNNLNLENLKSIISKLDRLISQKLSGFNSGNIYHINR